MGEPQEDIPWGHEGEKVMPVDSMTEFEGIIARSYELEKDIAYLTEKHITPLSKEKHELEMKILATLQHFNKKSHKTQHGTVIRVERFSVNFPKDPSDKQKLIEFMGQSDYINMSTINHQTFNSYYKGKLDEAVEAGNMEFELPGVGKPKYVEHLQKRKA